MVRSKAATDYKKEVQRIAQSLEHDLTDESVLVIIELKPKLTVKGEASKTCLDIDNCLKVALDALQGIVYENDKQVKKIIAEVGYPVVDGGLKIQVLKYE